MKGKPRLVGSLALLITVAEANLLPGQSPPEPNTPRPADPVTLELYRQYVAPIGKIESDTANAAIEFVAVRSGSEPEFQELLRLDFATSRQADNQLYDSRKLLELITEVLGREGRQRWQHEKAKYAGFPVQRVLLAADQHYQDSSLWADVIRYGRQCNRSEIDDFAFAVRQAHHPQGKQFLLDILQNSRVPDDPYRVVRPQGPWPDNTGGTWEEAYFHAAVGLAELGVQEGVRWLIDNAKPNDFGIDGNVDRHRHARITSSNLRSNCTAALGDLFGQPTQGDGNQPNREKWWDENVHCSPLAR